MKQHKWHKEIKAWADGAEIEFKDINENWRFDSNPFWNGDSLEFRIKPQPIPKGFPCNNSPTGIKEPQYLYVYCNGNEIMDFSKINHGKDNYIGKIKLEVEDGN
jgi:hypothetical protein